DDIDHLLSFLYGNALLGIVPELYGVPDNDLSTVYRYPLGDQVQEGRFARAVLPDDAHPFSLAKGVIKFVENGFIPIGLGYFVQFQDLAAQAFHIELEFHLMFLFARQGPLFYFLEIIDAGL